MIGTSGTVTTVGAAHLGLKRYDRRKVDGMRLSARAIEEVIARFLRLGPEGRRSDIGLGRDRSELIMSGAAILQTLLRIWPTESMRVADRGLREGMLFAMMSAQRRLRRGRAARVTGGGKGGGGKGSGRGRRDLRVRVKTAKGRKLSSTRWLERQLNDPYVARARAEGYRSRAAFKLIEIDDQLRLPEAGGAGGRPRLRAGRLGAGGGGADQRARRAAGASRSGGCSGIDLQEVEPIPGAELHVLDFLDEGADAGSRDWLGGRADVVISDMAAAASGHPPTDHLRIMALCEAAAEFAMDVLEPGGSFVAKVLAGGAEASLVGGAEPGLRQGAARQAAGEPQGFVGEVPGGDGISRAASRSIGARGIAAGG